MMCFTWIYLPLILAAVIAVIFSYVASWILGFVLKNQEEAVRKEVKEPWDSKRMIWKRAREEERRKIKEEHDEVER